MTGLNPHSFRLERDDTPLSWWTRLVDRFIRGSSSRVTVTPCRADANGKLEFTKQFVVVKSLDDILDWLKAMSIPFGIANDGIYVHPRTCEDTAVFIGRWVARL